MNKYETVIIINDTLTQENKDETIKKIAEYISKDGNILEQETIGSKKLAYEVKKQKTGYYCIMKFESEPTFISELERVYRITEEILKFIVVRQD